MSFKNFANLDKIGRQSVFLVLLVLSGELLFVGLLWNQLAEAEQEIRTETKLKEVFRRSQILVFQLDDYQKDLQTWFKTRSPESAAAIEKREEEMSRATDLIEANLKEYPELQESVSSLKDLQDRLFKIVELARKVLGGMRDKMQVFAFVQKFHDRGDRIRKEWERQSINLLSGEEGVLDTFPELQNKRRNRIAGIVVAGAVLNVILVIFLALFFLRNIVLRLDVLLENTKKLALREKMLERISGNDELANLDAAMHHMAEKLEKLQSERQAFLAMVSHELRTPLMSVSSTFEMISAGILGKFCPANQELALKAEKQLETLLKQINDLLDLEKLEAGKILFQKKQIYLETIIERSIQKLEEAAKEKGITFVCPETDLEVEADPERCSQALTKVLENAIKFAPAGSQVLIDCIASPETASIKVFDSGPGPSAEMEPQLFNRFRQFHDDKDPAIKGMGLPIARNLMQAQDGDLRFVRTENGQSCFTLSLPLLRCE